MQNHGLPANYEDPFPSGNIAHGTSDYLNNDPMVARSVQVTERIRDRDGSDVLL